jgi:hypothetical protein
VSRLRSEDNWLKGIAHWRLGKTVYLSIVFTWDLPEALRIIESNPNKKFVVGGPAVKLMPDYLAGKAEIRDEIEIGDVEPLMFHNPLATFTTRGCPNACKFCAVPKIEGKFKELERFRVAPYVCDNNLLEATQKHFDRVIDLLKNLPFVDFNQGLEAGKFKPHHASRMAELKHVKVRFAFDSWKEQSNVANAIQTAREAGLKDFGVYCLIGFDDTPPEAREKLEWIRSLGAMPNPMRYQPLTEPHCLIKNSYVAKDKGWTDGKLKDMSRYYSNLIKLDHVPFAEYKARRHEPVMTDLFA